MEKGDIKMNVELWDNEKNKCISIVNIEYVLVYTEYIKLITFDGIGTKYKTNKYELRYIKHVGDNKCQK